MEHAPMKEPSPAPSTAPKGFKGVMAKARLGRKDETPPAISWGTGADETGDRNSLRNSIDSLVRNSTRSSTDEGQPGNSSKMAKLIPKRIKRKIDEKQQQQQQQVDEEDLRGRSVKDQTATSADGLPPNNMSLRLNQSRSTLGEDEGNSLLSMESDTQMPALTAPPLVSRDSHIGYLTSSSPLVKTAASSEEIDGHPLENSEFHNPQYQKSNTLPIGSGSPSLSSNLALQHASSFSDRNSQASVGKPDRSTSRGVSPGARIRDVFTVGSRQKGSSPPKSPNRGTMNSDSNGNGLAGYKKRKNIALGKSGAASDSLQSLNTDPSRSATSSKADLPSIVTPPQTPPSLGPEAPATTVTPPTPTDPRRLSQDLPGSPTFKNRPAGTNANTVTSPSGNMISHRRARSDSATHAPSKLSNAMSAPLSPMPEEVRTPGSQGSPGGGFFSSVFSAAQNMTQNMTTQLTNTIANNPPRSRSSTQENNPPQAIGEDGTSEAPDDAPMEEKKPLAIDTLGSGELTFSHLGIDTPATANSATLSFTNGSEKGSGIMVHQEEVAARAAEDASVARAVSQAYSEKPVTEHATPVADGTVPPLRPRSTYESSIATGDKTPPNGSIYEGDNGFRRSGSVRSKVGAVARRHRNSSSTTGGGIAAAMIGASHAALANPAAAGSHPKLTGFAVASKKRNRDFHQFFRSVPEDDYLIEDYSCALQRDIILAGRIYVSEGHICFSSNILGWVTTLVIGFDEVVSVEKENTAMVFPNAIAIQTLHARHTFRSLLSREATYDLLIGIWKLSHPTLKSSLNGVRLDNAGTGDKTEKIDPTGSDETSELSEEAEEVYDEDDDEEEGVGSVTEGGDGSVAASEDVGEQGTKPTTRKPSAMGVAVGAVAGGVPTASETKAVEKAAVASAQSADFPGPTTHEPTECNDSAAHFEKVLKDDIIPAPLGKVYSMAFGSASGGFMAKWLLDEIKVTDLQNMEDDKKGLFEQGQSRSYSYVKPLNAPIGPKTTKCLVTETVDFLDYEKSVSVTASTQTPDVPSGNIFVVKTHFCLMWAPGNQTRVLVNYNIEWSGKSWIKGAIESGATSGQATYCNDLVKALKAGVVARPRAGTSGSKPSKPSKGGKRRKGDSSSSKATTATKGPDDSTAATDSSWGPLEPLHGVLGPISDILSPLLSSNLIISFLLFIILFNYLRSGPSKTVGGLSNYGITPSPERIAAYEAIWQRQEADLWAWLEERVGMQGGGASYPASGAANDALLQAKRARQQNLRGRAGMGMREKVRELKMGAREVEEAIRVTEERLKVLKGVVDEERRLKEKKTNGVS